MNFVQIEKYKIGKKFPPFIVGEAGINHNGELEKAIKMIKIAKKSGLNAIKFQTYKTNELVLDKKLTYTYKSNGKSITESMYDMFSRYELSKEEWKKIKKKCDEEKILFLSTPQNESDLDLLLELGIPAIKIGSDDFTNISLLKKFSETCLPIILSCGMANQKEIYKSLDSIGTFNKYPTILLLTTSQYPTPPIDANLLKLKTLTELFPKVPLGYSDHTIGHFASVIAVALDACFFEKHFTLDHRLSGPDHWFSEEPTELKKWADSIKLAKTLLGSRIIIPTKNEIENKKKFRRKIIALKQIKKNEVFDKYNIGMRRISKDGGLPLDVYDSLIGKKSHTNYKTGDLIRI